MDKKGLSLSILAILILALISLGIMLVIIIKSGLLSELRNIVAIYVTSLSSLVRGVIVDLLWLFFGAVLLIVFLMLFLFGSLCKAFPIGTAACTAMYAAFAVWLTLALLNIFSAIPLFSPTTSDINVGTSTHHVAPDVFMKEVAGRTVDCWSMYAKGRYDPLTGLTPPNPKTCFVINFNLTHEINVSDILNYMAAHNFTSGMDYLTAAGGTPIVFLDGRSWDGGDFNEDPFKKTFHEGRLYIKYGDDFLYSSWYSPDCDISGSWSPPDRTVYNTNVLEAFLTPSIWAVDNIFRWLGHNNDYVYWCFDEDVTK